VALSEGVPSVAGSAHTLAKNRLYLVPEDEVPVARFKLALWRYGS
jgi:hypothetical protein